MLVWMCALLAAMSALFVLSALGQPSLVGLRPLELVMLAFAIIGALMFATSAVVLWRRAR
jgi:hypothetical protein